MLTRHGIVLRREVETWQHTHVGRFRVEGVLGRGGMGVVLRAYDPHLQRPVAIKLLTDAKQGVREGITVNLRERVDHDGLLDEARALAQITDPNVLAVHEIGTEKGQTFLVMELVEGTDLRNWLASAPRSLADIYNVMAQAARGLAAAHRRGIIHRDFKPENILISADGRARVCDFGIAAFSRKGELIHTGTAGTPRYMAPELWRDQAASVQSDVYAFAATLIEAICSALSADPAVIERELAKRDVHPRLRGTLVRALDPTPSKRPASIDEITRAFTTPRRTRWLVPLALASAAALGIGTLTFALRHVDRSEDPCANTDEIVAARWNVSERVAVRAGIVAVGASSTETDNILTHLDQYAESWRRLRNDTCSAKVPAARRPARLACLDRKLYDLTAVVHALYHTPKTELAYTRSMSLPDLGACIEATEVRLPAGAAVRSQIEELTAKMIKLYDEGLATLASEGDQAALAEGRKQAIELGDIELAVRIDRIRGQLLTNAGKLAAAEKIMDEGIQLALEHKQDTVAALALVEAALVTRSNNDLSGADSKLRIAKMYLERSPEATPYSRMRLYRAIADVAADRGKYDEAEQALAEASAAVSRMEPRDPLWLVQLGLQRASLLDREGKLDQALQVARSAETQARALGTQSVWELGDLLALIQDLERQRGNLDVAVEIYKERLLLLSRAMPEDNPGRVWTEGLFGDLLITAGQFERAKDVYVRTVAHIERVPALARMHADFINRVAQAERLLGNFERARVLLQSAIDEERSHGRLPSVGYHEISFTYLELEAGDFDRAAVHARVAEELLATEAAESVNRLDIAETQIAIALGRGKPAEADKIASRVLALFEERKIDDARNERFWLAAAAARSLLGRPVEAKELAERALARCKARNAPALEITGAEAELALASYLIDHKPETLDRLRRHVAALDDPQARLYHARFLRWFASNRIRP